MSAQLERPLRLLRATQRAVGLVNTVRDAQRDGRRLIAATPPGRERSTGAAQLLHRVSRQICERHGFEVALEGALPTGPVVLAANHLSYVDPVAIMSRLPCLPIAKAEAQSWPLLGPTMSALGVLFVDRAKPWSGAKMLRRAVRALAAGVPVLGFPEGTTTHGRRLLPFQLGLFALAERAKVPVVPVAVLADAVEVPWVGDAGFAFHYLKLGARKGTRIRLRFGAPITAEGRSAEELAIETQAAMRRLLEE